MTGLEISIYVKPQKRQEFLRAVELLADRERKTGCLSLEVFEEYGKPNHFLWLERWPSRLRAEERMQSERFHALRGAITVLGELQSLNVVQVEEPDRQTAGKGAEEKPGQDQRRHN